MPETTKVSEKISSILETTTDSISESEIRSTLTPINLMNKSTELPAVETTVRTSTEQSKISTTKLYETTESSKFGQGISDNLTKTTESDLTTEFLKKEIQSQTGEIKTDLEKTTISADISSENKQITIEKTTVQPDLSEIEKDKSGIFKSTEKVIEEVTTKTFDDVTTVVKGVFLEEDSSKLKTTSEIPIEKSSTQAQTVLIEKEVSKLDETTVSIDTKDILKQTSKHEEITTESPKVKVEISTGTTSIVFDETEKEALSNEIVTSQPELTTRPSLLGKLKMTF